MPDPSRWKRRPCLPTPKPKKKNKEKPNKQRPAKELAQALGLSGHFHERLRLAGQVRGGLADRHRQAKALNPVQNDSQAVLPALYSCHFSSCPSQSSERKKGLARGWVIMLGSTGNSRPSRKLVSPMRSIISPVRSCSSAFSAKKSMTLRPSSFSFSKSSSFSSFMNGITTVPMVAPIFSTPWPPGGIVTPLSFPGRRPPGMTFRQCMQRTQCLLSIHRVLPSPRLAADTCSLSLNLSDDTS